MNRHKIENSAIFTSNDLVEKEWLLIGLIVIILGILVSQYRHLIMGLIVIAQGASIVLIASWRSITENKATIIVGLVTTAIGISATLLVYFKSAEKINNLVGDSTQHIDSVLKTATERTVKQIAAATFPNEFVIRIHNSKGWCEAMKGETILLKNYERKCDVKFEWKKLQEIDVETRDIVFHFRILNITKFPARDVWVYVYFKKGEFEKDRIEFEKKFKEKNSLKLHEAQPRFKRHGFTEATVFSVPVVLPLQQINLLPVNLNLKKNLAFLRIQINEENFYYFVFRVKPKRS